MARLDLAVIRLQFYGSIRMELYEALSLLLENRVLLDVALRTCTRSIVRTGRNRSERSLR